MDMCFLIPAVIELILNDNPNVRCCAGCPSGCNDLTKFICMGLSSKDINEYIENNPDKIKECEEKFWREL